MDDFIFITQIVAVSFLGLILGSFATALTWRVPRGISWVMASSKKDSSNKDSSQEAFARSHCTSCNEQLRALDLVPVLSWLFLRGRCRHCKAAIGTQYLFIEVATLCAVLGVYIAWGLSPEFVVLMFTIPFLAALFAIDVEYMILPNQLVLIVGVLGGVFIGLQGVGGPSHLNWGDIALNRVGGMVSFAFIAWFTGFIMTHILRKDALGFGDVKFFAVAGLWLGIGFLPFFLIFSGTIGILWGGYFLVILKKQRFPFGPALIISFYVAMLLQGMGWDPLGLIP